MKDTTLTIGKSMILIAGAILVFGYASVMPTMMNTRSSQEAQNDFLMTEYETFKGSDGLEVAIHPVKADKERYLLLGTGPVFRETLPDEAMMYKIALEYAKKRGYEVRLINAVEYYYWGNSGYAFTVLESKVA